MANLLTMVGGRRVVAATPSKYLQLSGGRLIEVTTGDGIQLVGGRLVAETGGTTVDPTELPVASTQVPRWDTISIPTSAGNYYTEPHSSVKVWRLTDSTTPGSAWHVHYYSQWRCISTSYGDNEHHILYHDEMPPTGGGSFRLLDFERGVGPSNYRTVSIYTDRLASFHPTEPHYLIYCDSSAVIHRYDCLNDQLADSGYFPKNLKADTGVTSVLGTGFSVYELQVHGSAETGEEPYVTVQTGGLSGGALIAWRSSDDDVVVNNDITWASVATFESPWYYVFGSGRRYRIDTDSYVSVPTSFYHDDWGNRYAILPDGDYRTWKRYDSSDNTDTSISLNAGNSSAEIVHISCNWRQSESTSQWAVVSYYHYDGSPQADTDEIVPSSGWTQHDGNIYKCSSWNVVWSRGVNVNAVFEGSGWGTGDFLTEVGSVGAMSEKTFYFDGLNTCYVWQTGGGSPSVTCLDIHAGMAGIVLVKMDASSIRFLCHHWTRPPGTSGLDYWHQPHATISPDGKLVVFASDMNDDSGRVDLFAAEVPLV